MKFRSKVAFGLVLASSILAISSTATASQSRLVVPVTVNFDSAEHYFSPPMEDFPGMEMPGFAGDQLTCSFDDFYLDTNQYSGVDFEIDPAQPISLQAGAQLSSHITAFVSGACDAFSSQDLVRYGVDAQSDDVLLGTNVPAFQSNRDSSSKIPVGLWSEVTTQHAASAWTLDSYTVGVPKFNVPSGVFRKCYCNIGLWGQFDVDPGPLFSLQAAPEPEPEQPVEELPAPAQLLAIEAANEEQCSFGGAMVHRGSDDGLPEGIANNGLLEAGEWDASIPVCNGATGQNGTNGSANLVQWTPELGTEHCAAGGIRIASGLDDGSHDSIANDNILQGGEEDSVTYVCNGIQGAGAHSSLVAMSDVGPGEVCAEGGVRIASGLDDGGLDALADDGALAPEEEDMIRYVCHGITGEQGEQGQNGHNALVTVNEVKPGEECASGGVRIDTGIDDGAGDGQADDGILHPAEVDMSQLLCNGSNGEEGEPGADGQDGVDGLDGEDGLDAETDEEIDPAFSSAGGGCSVTNRETSGGWLAGCLVAMAAALRLRRRAAR